MKTNLKIGDQIVRVLRGLKFTPGSAMLSAQVFSALNKIPVADYSPEKREDWIANVVSHNYPPSTAMYLHSDSGGPVVEARWIVTPELLRFIQSLVSPASSISVEDDEDDWDDQEDEPPVKRKTAAVAVPRVRKIKSKSPTSNTNEALLEQTTFLNGTTVERPRVQGVPRDLTCVVRNYAVATEGLGRTYIAVGKVSEAMLKFYSEVVGHEDWQPGDQKPVFYRLVDSVIDSLIREGSLTGRETLVEPFGHQVLKQEAYHRFGVSLSVPGTERRIEIWIGSAEWLRGFLAPKTTIEPTKPYELPTT